MRDDIVKLPQGGVQVQEIALHQRNVPELQCVDHLPSLGDLTGGIVDAHEFVFRSFKIPKSEELDSISWFQHRMISLGRFQTAFTAFYRQFLTERTNPETWADTQKDIHKWVSTRQTKK